jgi:prolyl oligopeptidase
MKLLHRVGIAITVGAAMTTIGSNASGQIKGGNGITLPAPPVTEKNPITDDLHGHKVTDDYRWLEDQKSPATRTWIGEENKYTDAYFSQLRDLPAVAEAIGRLERVDAYSAPAIVEEHGTERYFFKKRLADENQGSIYLRTGWRGTDELLIDAKKLSADQNTSVGIDDVTEDGSLLVYGIRQGGADEQEVHVFDVKTRTTLPDQLKSDRYFGVQVSPDKTGLYYALFTHAGTVIYFHKFGTGQSADAMIFGKEYRGEKLGELDLVGASVSDNGHFLIITIGRGVPATRQDILLKDLRRPDAPVAPLVYGIDNRFNLLDAGDDSFYVQTDYKAPKYRILKAEFGTSPDAWKTIVPETADVIQSSSIVGGKLFVDRLIDVKDETTIYSLDGKKTGELKYPGIGSGTVVFGRPRAKMGVYSFTSFNVPTTIYRYDTKTGESELFAKPKVPFDSDAYEVKQVFYSSKDGTKVPMFIAGKKGWKQDGNTRLLLTGYGGFNVSNTPTWNSMYAWWMEQGGLFALPNLRGGGEYGEDWHKAGMFEHKQTVFDDFFAAAQYLIDNHYTNPKQLAIWGRSNGGLLMGAAMTQRPDLFGAIVCGYPLLDMLRYQSFEFGRLWTTEYGTADNAKDYEYLAKYSPYQNVKAGTKFPAIMFFTGDSDTRVDPLHARKMTAEVQAANAGDRPVLLHYSVKGGHSAGVSVDQQVQDSAERACGINGV